ncbi:hypothetical protein C8R48DRAFT_768824 [Suillus tomentosus]|nr:hypothetical protein C8R48DRAFT_768824 [Suillus tomentosus]
MVQHVERSVEDFANNNEVLKAHSLDLWVSTHTIMNPLTIWAAQDEGNISENEGIENDIDMQGLSPHRCLSINFNAVVLPDPNTPDLNHPNELPQAYKLDDIKVEYHPHSKLPSVVHHFADFSGSCSSEGQVPCNDAPWEPFQMQLDFEVAEIALKAAMTKEQTNRLLDLVHRSASGTDKFTLQSHDEFVRFIDEPWTANAFWNAQSQLLPDPKLLTFILYADKNKLSTFGTVKGYLIIACITNLPVHICNSNTTLGGGRVVGWLPIVAEDQKHTRKKSFVDFKNTAWHKSFYQLLKSIELHSKNGYWFECGDQTWHHLWPLILILSGDYEEQCVMALICGLKGKFPCPCQFPTGPSHRESKTYGKEREEDLKAYSLRNVENVFSTIFLTDVHRTLSIDHLHMNHEGLWEDHLWKELLFWISDLGREAATKLDTNFDAIP